MDEEDKQKIRVAAIFDVIGKPPEHLVSTLEQLGAQISNESGITVISKSVKEPVLMKDSKEFYTTFMDMELEVEEILYLVILLFKYMPAHIEVIEPETLVLSNYGWNDILNELARRLHGFDEIARILQAENNELRRRLSELSGKQVITPMTLKSEVKEMPKEKKPRKTKKKAAKKTSKKKVSKKKK